MNEPHSSGNPLAGRPADHVPGTPDASHRDEAPDPTGLSAGSPQDILAFVPHCLGFVPEESLVLMTLRGRSLGATLRLDLPGRNVGFRTDRARARAEGRFEADYCARVCGVLSGDEDADGALMVIYTQEPWIAGQPPPYSGLVRRLRQGLERQGLELRDGWLSGNGHFRDYFCSSHECCPWPGFPLDQIAESRLNAELVFRGSTYSSSLQAAVGLAGAGLPGSSPPDPETARSQAASRRSLAGRWTQPEHFVRTLEAWDQRFKGRHSLQQDGLLLASLESKPIRDAVLVLAALDLPTAVAGSRYWLSAEKHGAGRDDAGGESMGGESMGGEDAGQPWNGSADAGTVFRSVLIGRGSHVVPDWDGLDRAHDALSDLLRSASGESAAAVLTLLGWLEWARGRSSRANLCLSGALQVHPGYRLAQLLQALLMRGELPEWSQSPQTAWKGGGAG